MDGSGVCCTPDAPRPEIDARPAREAGVTSLRSWGLQETAQKRDLRHRGSRDMRKSCLQRLSRQTDGADGGMIGVAASHMCRDHKAQMVAGAWAWPEEREGDKCAMPVLALKEGDRLWVAGPQAVVALVVFHSSGQYIEHLWNVREANAEEREAHPLWGKDAVHGRWDVPRSALETPREFCRR